MRTKQIMNHDLAKHHRILECNPTDTVMPTGHAQHLVVVVGGGYFKVQECLPFRWNCSGTGMLRCDSATGRRFREIIASGSLP